MIYIHDRAIPQVHQLQKRISLQNNNKIDVGHKWLYFMTCVDRPLKCDRSAHSVVENGRVRVHPRVMPKIMPTHSSYTPHPQHIHMAHTHTHIVSKQREDKQRNYLDGFQGCPPVCTCFCFHLPYMWSSFIRR